LERIEEEATFCLIFIPLKKFNFQINRVVETQSLGLSQIVSGIEKLEILLILDDVFIFGSFSFLLLFGQGILGLEW
jgi:hypothetical protein